MQPPNNLAPALSEQIHLIRFPLLLNNVVCMGLGFAVFFNPIFLSQAIFHVLSSLLCVGVLAIRQPWRSKSRTSASSGPIYLEFDPSNKPSKTSWSALFLAGFDLAFAIAFFVLYIVGTIYAEDYWSRVPTLFAAYITFGSLIAWVLHLCILLPQLHFWLKQRFHRAPKAKCPHCGSRSRSSPALTPDIIVEEGRTVDNQQVQEGKGKASFETTISEDNAGEGESETDRLIMQPGADE